MNNIAVRCALTVLRFGLLSLVVVQQQIYHGSTALAQEGKTAPEQSVAGAAQLTIAQSIHNFGTVTQGQKVAHDFELVNTGSAPLVIKSIQPSCGCTAADVDKNTLQPNERTALKAVFDTTGFQGYKVKTIRIHTNDPMQPSMVVGFQGTVNLDVSIDQSRIYFGPVTRGQIDPRGFTVRPADGSNVKILDISSRSEYVELQEEKSADGGKKVVVRLKDTVPIGTFRARIVVKTTSDRNPVINIPIFARVEGDLKLEPPDISFGLLEGPLDQAITQKFRLINKSAEPVNIVSTHSSNAAINIAVEPLAPGKEYQLSVSVGPGTVGPLRGQITIHTDHKSADQSDLTLPVYGIVTRKGA